MTRLLSRRSLGAWALAAGLPALVPTHAFAVTEPDDPKRAQRWRELREDLFDNRPTPAADWIRIEAPARAADAALVPMTLHLSRREGVKAVHLVIDENPAPYAAKIAFGPAGDPRSFKLRVRVNDYTHVHAVAEMDDGKLYQTSTFVKAAGGCSAPAGASELEALRGAGQMRMRFARAPEGAEATLMLRHPNFSGMQMDQVTRLYTPARYVKQVKVTQADRLVFDLTGDISIATDPVFGFLYDASHPGGLDVIAVDSTDARWAQSFNTAAA
jgi:sulfur-oxidizing protein SoxY